MAAGFIAKVLSTLAASTARWVEFADASVAPVHGSVALDPTTGLPIDIAAASLVKLKDDLAIAASAAVTGVLFTQDMNGYGSITVDIVDIGGGGTIIHETSDDQVNWRNCTGKLVGTTASAYGAMLETYQDTGVGMRQFQRKGRYFRSRISAITSGTISVVGTASATHATGNTMVVTGPSDHSSNYAGRPIIVGGRVSTALDTTLANNDASLLLLSKSQQVVTTLDAIGEAKWSYPAPASGIVNKTSADQVKAAIASMRNVITTIQISAGALSAATELVIRDGAGGTVLWRMGLTTAGLAPTTFNVRLPSTTNTLLEVATLTAVTGSIYFNAQGHSEVG